MMTSIISRNIKILREKKKITQEELAKRLGVSRQAICMWETGRREISLTTLNKLAEIFGVSVNYLIGGVMARKGEKKVKFELKAPQAKSVFLTGDFNSWNQEGIPLKKGRTGTWSVEIPLKPGRYEYKFIVDGQWITDPANPNKVTNPFGSENSVKEVK